MFNLFRTYLILIATAGLLLACSDSEAPQEKAMAKAEEAKAVQLPAEVPVAVEEAASDTGAAAAETVKTADAAVEEAKTEVAEKVQAVTEDIPAVASDKPYQVVDGKISENAIEGWKTFNGGGCGACHGKGAIGGVGPNLGNSVTTKLTKEQFFDTVTNGRPGTLMRAHKTNKRVMDNLENLYAYLVARGDGVLGPGNLIKFPLGKE